MVSMFGTLVPASGGSVGPHSDLLDGFPYLGLPHGFTPKGIKENL
jgi:hypothetical protein